MIFFNTIAILRNFPCIYWGLGKFLVLGTRTILFL